MEFNIKDYEIGKRPLWAIAASLLIFIALAFFAVNCVAFGEGSGLLPIYSVDTDEKEIVITFNCAWAADDIPQILKILDEHGAKATFFILGQWAEENPSAVKMIADAGHEIGTHSNTHPDMAKIPPDEIRKELDEVRNDLIYNSSSMSQEERNSLKLRKEELKNLLKKEGNNNGR